MDTFYTAEQLAEHFQISVYTVLRLIKNGSLSATKIGRQWRIMQEDIDLYIIRRTLKAKKQIA